MRLAEIVATSARVGLTSSRLAKVDALAGCLRGSGADEVGIAVNWLSGSVRQQRLGIGGAALDKVRHASEPSPESTLTLMEVDALLERIAGASGPRSGADRLRLLAELFARATAVEQDFLTRLIVGELRQGAVEGLMIDAVARAAKVGLDDVRRAVMVTGDFAAVAEAALAGGAAALARFAIELFHPVQPMLAGSVEGTDEALQELGEAAFEFKLDGARVQVHKAANEVRVFSRRLNDVTRSVPDIVEAVRALPLDDAILDGEALSFRPDGSPQPFQVTMRRFGRKLDVEASRAALPLRPFFFDCLRLDGEDLTLAPAHERAAALSAALPSKLIVPRTVTAVPSIAQAFFDEALGAGHEGAMAKSLDGIYAAGARGRTWLKIKQATTLDLVVLAAEWGHGRRRGWLSNLHLGARDPENGGYVMLGKTFKGMTDAMLRWQTERLLQLEIARDAWTVYTRPELVVEIAFNDIQQSPHYPGGLALRFARLKRYRPDKQAAESDTIATVRSLAQRQTVRQSVGL
jgi:ATP-dependent DNA ligase I